MSIPALHPVSSRGLGGQVGAVRVGRQYLHHDAHRATCWWPPDVIDKLIIITNAPGGQSRAGCPTPHGPEVAPAAPSSRHRPQSSRDRGCGAAAGGDGGRGAAGSATHQPPIRANDDPVGAAGPMHMRHNLSASPDGCGTPQPPDTESRTVRHSYLTSRSHLGRGEGGVGSLLLQGVVAPSAGERGTSLRAPGRRGIGQLELCNLAAGGAVTDDARAAGSTPSKERRVYSNTTSGCGALSASNEPSTRPHTPVPELDQRLRAGQISTTCRIRDTLHVLGRCVLRSSRLVLAHRLPLSTAPLNSRLPRARDHLGPCLADGLALLDQAMSF